MTKRPRQIGRKKGERDQKEKREWGGTREEGRSRGRGGEEEKRGRERENDEIEREKERERGRRDEGGR